MDGQTAMSGNADRMVPVRDGASRWRVSGVEDRRSDGFSSITCAFYLFMRGHRT